MAVTVIKQLYGQGVVGQHVSVPWLDPSGPYEITQGYGPTSVQAEPIEDKQGKRQRWHSGVDIACSPNTTVVMPANTTAKAIHRSNPGGYGTYLVLQLYHSVTLAGKEIFTQRADDLYLGHLSGYLVKDGQLVRGGDQLALTGSTGNSTGPHLHFEARPPDGQFGTDIDPSNWLLTVTADGAGTNLSDALGAADPFGIKAAEKSLMNTLTGLAQTALGGSLMLAGGVTMGFGLRGMGARQAARVTRRTAGRLGQRRAEFDVNRPRVKETPQVTAAGRTRLRSSLRREVPQTATGPATLPTSSRSGAISGGEERAVLRAEMAATGQRAKPGAAIRARARYAKPVRLAS